MRIAGTPTARSASSLGGLLVLGAVAALTAVPVVGDASDAAVGLPTERLTIDDLDYRGAFRLSSDTFGVSNTNYAVGTLGYNPVNHSLFIAGHAQHNAVAEFAIPPTLGTGDAVGDLPVVESPLQPFVAFLDNAPTGNPDGIDRIDGLFVDDDNLIVNAERWYDAAGTARDTTLVVDAADLDGAPSGYFELDGGVRAAGYMSSVPSEWRSALGGPLLTGWASNTSIISRHSVGPTLFTVDPSDLYARDPIVDPSIATQVHMDFPYQGQRWLAPGALDSGPTPASPLWNFLAKARVGFIAPGTSTFVVLGEIGGTRSGIGYKITQDDGNVCGGYCAYAADDYDNAYWLFDVHDILAADDVHLPRPYSYGTWSVPFDDGGSHRLIGGTFDQTDATLYLALENAGQVGTYDRPPLILAYSVPSTSTFVIERGARAIEPAVRID